MVELWPCVHEALNSIPSTAKREEKKLNEMKEKDSRPQNMIAFYPSYHEVARSLAMLPVTDAQGPSSSRAHQILLGDSRMHMELWVDSGWLDHCEEPSKAVARTRAQCQMPPLWSL